MLFEARQALEALRRPAVGRRISKIFGNAVPGVVSPRIPVGPPLTIYWIVNTACNLRCKMCDIGLHETTGTFYKALRGSGTATEISHDRFVSVIDEIKASRPLVCINGTEPLLYGPLFDALAYCSSAGLKTSVVTNGYKLPDCAESLVDAGLSQLIISLDGPASVHNDIRGKTDSFQRCISGTRKAKAYAASQGKKLEVYVNFAITSMNAGHLVDFVEAVANEPIDAIDFTHSWFITPENAVEHNALFGDRYPVTKSCLSENADPFKVDIDLLFDQMQQVKHVKNVSFLPFWNKHRLRQFYHEPGRFMYPNARCMASWFIAQIFANGDVVPYSRCHNQPLGNINDGRFLEIWNGRAMKEWRAFITKHRKMPMCKRCDLVY